MASINPMVEAAYYTREEGYYKCELCPHRCHIRPGSYGKCGSRYGEDDMLVAYTYGKLSSICVDPIEKKPLYHFYPGAKTFRSVASDATCHAATVRTMRSPSIPRARSAPLMFLPRNLSACAGTRSWT